MKSWPKIFVACVSTLGVAACDRPAAWLTDAQATPPLTVTEAWARAADSGATTAVYLTVDNAAMVSDTLSAVTSDVAEDVGLHISMAQNGTMHMAQLRALPVPAQDSVPLRPMGAHLMLTRLRRPLVEDDTVVVTLTFVSGTTIEVRAGVRKP